MSGKKKTQKIANCSSCGGSGKTIEVITVLGPKRKVAIEHPCPKCNGSGKVVYMFVCFGPDAGARYIECLECGGSGNAK